MVRDYVCVVCSAAGHVGLPKAGGNFENEENCNIIIYAIIYWWRGVEGSGGDIGELQGIGGRLEGGMHKIILRDDLLKHTRTYL